MINNFFTFVDKSKNSPIDLLNLLLLCMGMNLMQRGIVFLSIATPVQDQLFSDNEQHDTNLGDGKEAPDGGLFHQVSSDVAGQQWTGGPQEDTLDDHVSLHDKEGAKHQKRVDSGARTPVSRIIHRDGPGQMVVSVVCAQFFSSQPFGSSV